MSGIDDCLKSVERLTRDRGEVMRAADDRIEKIRARHAEAEIALRGTGWLRKVHPHDAPEWAMDAHDHRATLLAEVEHLRAENKRLFEEVERIDDLYLNREKALSATRAEIETLTRERDEARAGIERQAHHIEELREKIDAEKSCACSFDAPGDVCVAHSPALMQAWEDGWFARDCWDADWHQNPYQRKKKETEP